MRELLEYMTYHLLNDFNSVAETNELLVCLTFC